MAKPISVRVKVTESEAFAVMRKLRKIPGVVGLDLDFGDAIGAPHGLNGARKPKGVPHASKRMALLKALADGKPHSYDEVRERMGDTAKGFHNTRYNAVRDGAAKIVGKGMLQISARGVEQLKASK